MATAAQLQISVQTSGVHSATAALRELVEHGRRAELATDRLRVAFSSLSTVGAHTEHSTLGLISSLDRLVVEERHAERATDHLVSSLDDLSREAGSANSATSGLAGTLGQLPSRAVTRASGGIGRSFLSIGKAAGVAALAVGTATAAIVTKFSAQSKEMEKLARMANTGYEAFQGYAYAAESVGVSAEDLADISKDLRDKLGEFLNTGGGEFADFFELVAPKVGLTAQALQGLAGPDALLAVKSAMDEANVSAEQQVTYLESIGNNASLLIPLLEKNGEAFKKQASEARRLGAVLSEVDAENLREASKAVHRLEGAFSGLGKRLAAEFAPSFAESTDKATAGIARINAALASGEFEEYLGILKDNFEFFSEDLGRVSNDATTYISSAFNDLTRSMGIDFDDSKKAIIKVLKTLPQHAKYCIQRMGIEIAAFVEYGKIYGKAFGQAIVSSLDNLLDKVAVYGKELADRMNPFDGDTFDFSKHLAAVNQKAAGELKGIYDRAKAQAEINRKVRIDMLGQIEKDFNYNVEAGLAKFDQRLKAAREKYLKYLAGLDKKPASPPPSISDNGPSLASDAVTKAAEKEAERLEKIREREFQSLQSYLRTEEETILESYKNRLRIIEENTKGGSEEQGEMKGRLTDKFSTEMLGDFVKEPTIDEKIEKIREEEARKRDAILEETALTQTQKDELVERLEEGSRDKIKKLEGDKFKDRLSASSQFFGDMTDLAKVFAGEQSSVYKGLFAVTKAHSLAKATLKAHELYMEAAASVPPPANAGPIAIALAQGAAGIAKVAAVNFAGAFDKGGHIPAGKFGLVGEYGMEFINGPANVTSRKDTTKMLEQATSQKVEPPPPPQVHVKNINVLDSSVVGDYLETSDDAERIIMNIVRRNQGALG